MMVETSIREVSPSLARIARNRSLACSTPMMFSGFSRHSGMRVYSVARTSRTSSSDGRSALSITISVR